MGANRAIHVVTAAPIQPLTAARTLLKLVEKGMSREDSYDAVQEIAMRVWNREGTLQELALADPGIKSFLTDADVKELFNLDRYYDNIGFIYKKIG